MGLQQIQRHFLWGRGYLERKSYLVKWASVCLDKKNGRLGVSALICSTRLFLPSGFSGMQWKGKLYGSNL